jgi:hypothetical protein
MDAMVRIHTGDKMGEVRATYPQVYKWRKTYALVNNGVGGFILVDHPPEAFGLNQDDDINVDVDSVIKLTYFEAACSNIRKCHLPDHTKGRTLYAPVCQLYSNIGCSITKLYTETCLICISREVRNKPAAGIKPILTFGFSPSRMESSNTSSTTSITGLSYYSVSPLSSRGPPALHMRSLRFSR